MANTSLFFLDLFEHKITVNCRALLRRKTCL